MRVAGLADRYAWTPATRFSRLFTSTPAAATGHEQACAVTGSSPTPGKTARIDQQGEVKPTRHQWGVAATDDYNHSDGRILTAAATSSASLTMRPARGPDCTHGRLLR